MTNYVRDAFYVARQERRPTVLGVPLRRAEALARGRTRLQAVGGSYIPKPRPHAAQSEGRRERWSRRSRVRNVDRSRRPRRRLVRRASANRGRLAEPCGGHARERPCRRAACSITARSRSASAGGFASDVARELLADADVDNRGRREPHLLHGRCRAAVPRRHWSSQIDERRSGCAMGMQAAASISERRCEVEASKRDHRKSCADRRIQDWRLPLPEIAGKIATTPIGRRRTFRLQPGPIDPRECDRGHRPRHPEGLGRSCSGSGHSAYFPDAAARAEAGEFPRAAGVRRHRQFASPIALGVAAARKTGKRRADRRRRQPAHAHRRSSRRCDGTG